MPDENMISPHAFSACELVVKIDDNDLHIPINFGMSDYEVRKLYPHLLKVARIEDNPMTSFAARKDAGEFDSMSEEEYAKLLSDTEALSKYWCGKPTASLLDVAIAIALDMDMRNGKIDVNELFADSKLNTMFDPAAEKAMDVDQSEIVKIENKYGMKPDIEGPLTIPDEVKPHTGVAGGIFDFYGDHGAFDFPSDELDALERKNGIDRFTELLSANGKIDKDRYASTYDPSKPLDMSRVSDKGLFNIYPDDTNGSDVFDRLDENPSASESESDTEYEPIETEEEDNRPVSVMQALEDLADELDEDDDEDDVPYYSDEDDDTIPEIGLDEGMLDDDE